VEDGTIAAESCSHIDFGGEEGCLRCCIYWEGKEIVNCGGDFSFEYQGDIIVVGINMPSIC